MSNEPSSPVCYGAEADDIYMGYAGKDELLAALNILLEAERAGAHVARATRRAGGVGVAELMKKVGADEARWCAMLSVQIKRLAGVPSRKRGDFYEKAMAIADVQERLAFLNRGQAWVVRALDTLIPRVRDEALHRALREMLRSHIDNIATNDDLLSLWPRSVDMDKRA